MSGKTVTAQARPDPMPVAGQRPGPPFFRILIVAGLIVIGAGLRSTANIVAVPCHHLGDHRCAAAQLVSPAPLAVVAGECGLPA